MEVTPEQARLSVHVEEASQIGEARRAAARLAAACGLDETGAGRASIIATELATNLVRHARSGVIHLSRSEPAHDDDPCVELVATDSGPGMASVDRCLRDGYSTGGTAGQGLGAVQRLASEFDIHSTSGAGTVVFARVRGTQRRPNGHASAIEFGAFALAAPGEVVCGDAWRARARDGRLSVLLADGLGHGVLAAEAAEKACERFDRDPWAPPMLMLQGAHADLAATRGAAVSICQFDLASGVVSYAGVGNIAGALIGPADSRGLVTHNGIVGKQFPRSQPFSYTWPSKGLLIMWSDGLQSRWTLDRYPGIRQRHPVVIAATLARDYVRGRDDVTVFVARENPEVRG